MAIHQDLTGMSHDQLVALVQAMQARQKQSRKLQISEKGCVSLFAGRKMGIHLYAQEWLDIFDMADDIKAFIKSNRDELSWKSEADKLAAAGL